MKAIIELGKKFFQKKIYLWIVIVLLVIFSGVSFLSYSLGSQEADQNVKSYSMVKYIEKVQEVVFLNVGIQKVETVENATVLWGFTIPQSEKEAIFILNYKAKFGITEPVSVTEIGEKHYRVMVPSFKIIGVELDQENPYTLYDRRGNFLSGLTEEVDTGERLTSKLSNDAQLEYLKEYQDLIKESAVNYYTTLFKAIDSEIELEIQFIDE